MTVAFVWSLSVLASSLGKNIKGFPLPSPGIFADPEIEPAPPSIGRGVFTSWLPPVQATNGY